MVTREQVGIVAFFSLVFVLIAGIIGWMMNVYTIFTSDADIWTGMMIVRVIGVFVPPVGAIVGYF